MKRSLLLCVILLCMCSTLMAQEGDDPRIPVAGLCKQDPQSAQEVRFCKTFIKCMKKSDHYRDAVQPESAMVFTVIAVDDPGGEKMAYSLVIALHTAQLAGFQPIVWQKAGVIGYAEFKNEIELVLTEGLRVIVQWLPGALEASRNLCPEETGQYESVGLCSEHEVEDVVSEGVDMWSFEVK